MGAGRIVKVSGPLIVAEGMAEARMYEVARVSEKRLIGEIIELHGDQAYIQVYENTSGLGPGEVVESTGLPLSIELGPGLLQSIYDGIQRPLNVIYRGEGHFITRGIDVPGLDREKKWELVPNGELRAGGEIRAGDFLGEIKETELIVHKVMVPPTIGTGTLKKKPEKGAYTVEDTIAEIETAEGTQAIALFHRWPVRKPRPCVKKLMPEMPLVTGQRVIDTFFPISQGGTATVPGPFGSGKTVIQHQLAKWSDAHIIVYIGCGERGNEMTDVLQEFPELIDPATGRPLMERTVLIANTSNMPVAAREASVYTGITIAEYFRDMGFKVAVMADSTSRWAEAMREMSGRLEEMPGEEGYPAYLPSRIADFYERAGRTVCKCSASETGGEERIGSLSVIGAVSPPGGDLSDPVVQATLKVVKVFWSLEDQLAFERHFPAIGWLRSYSLYHDNMKHYYEAEVAPEWEALRTEGMVLLQKEEELKELVRLVGIDSLSPADRVVLETTKSIREDFLHQSAFDPDDAYTRLAKQYKMLKVIMELHHECLRALDRELEDRYPTRATQERRDILKQLVGLPVREKISRMKFIPEDRQEQFDEILDEIKAQMAGIFGGGKQSGEE
jgi:V/A-type H+-transporting ATPase subunit A